jgi:hypothetical protein
MTPERRAQYISDVEASLKNMRESLAPLQSGKLRIQERRSGEDWQDTTRQMIEHHKSSIATLESILAALRSGEVP